MDELLAHAIRTEHRVGLGEAARLHGAGLQITPGTDTSPRPTGTGLIVGGTVESLAARLVSALSTGRFPLALRGAAESRRFLPGGSGAEVRVEIPVTLRRGFGRRHPSLIDVLPFDGDRSELRLRNGRDGTRACQGAAYDRSWTSLERVLGQTELAEVSAREPLTADQRVGARGIAQPVVAG